MQFTILRSLDDLDLFLKRKKKRFKGLEIRNLIATLFYIFKHIANSICKPCCLIPNLQVASLGEGVSLEAKLLSRWISF